MPWPPPKSMKMGDSPSSSSSIPTNLFFLFLLLSTNLLTFFLFSDSSSLSLCSLNNNPLTTTTNTNIASSINGDPNLNFYEPTPDDLDDLPAEFLAYTSPQMLPFGFNSNFDSKTMHSPVGHSCTKFKDQLSRYMTYKINGSCPDDEILAQKLLLRGCEPLPRRRCRPAAPSDYIEPYPLPQSYWTTPSDNSIFWSPYTCKNYSCLINRKKNQKGFDDCKDCFDLNGAEKVRWTSSFKRTSLDFSIDEVLAVKKQGSIRIGLDIGGGAGTFAVRMRERNITIITTSMNFNGPFNNFIASRGVIPLYMSISQRLPFFDNTLDIVHSMHVMSNWIPTTLLHFMLFDIYRVLRPGGLFWLDHFFCVEEQLEVYGPLIESIGFKKVKWVLGKKTDRGVELREMYITALLEKPLKNSW